MALIAISEAMLTQPQVEKGNAKDSQLSLKFFTLVACLKKVQGPTLIMEPNRTIFVGDRGGSVQSPFKS